VQTYSLIGLGVITGFFFSFKKATGMSSMSRLAILFDYFLHYHGVPHCGINKTLIRIKHL
jgi:hypothetical protein